MFCICGLLSLFSVHAYAINDDNINNNSSKIEEDPSKKSSNASSTIILPQVDKFGVEMLYPTKAAGQEWYMNNENPKSDIRFNPQDQVTKNSDGSWKMRSDQVRMHVYASTGVDTSNLVTSGGSGQKSVAARGYMGSAADWKDVEITGYVKLNKFTDNDNFVWYSRGGRHTDSDQCQGSAYKGNLFYLGQTQFAKEQWHVSYAKSPTISATDSLEGRWIGFKFVMYNLDSNGKSAVKLENWLDDNADGKNFIKIYEGADAGKWGRAGNDCQVRADQILSWGGPIATFRWDFATDVDFRSLSVREINPGNTSLSGITYFKGSSKSSNVPGLGNTDQLDEEEEAYEPIRNASSLMLNRFTNTDNFNDASPSLNHRENTSGADNTPIGGEEAHPPFGIHQLAVGNNVYMVWVEGDEDNTEVYFKISSNGGVTFGKAVNLSNNPASLSTNPKIAVNGSNVYVVWEDDSGNSGNTDIFFMKSADGGESFGSKKNLSNDPAGSGTPMLALSGDSVYVTWSGTSVDDTDISLVSSNNKGDSFSTPQNVSNDPALSFNPQISVNGTHINLAWSSQNEAGLMKKESVSILRTPFEKMEIDSMVLGSSSNNNSTTPSTGNSTTPSTGNSTTPSTGNSTTPNPNNNNMTNVLDSVANTTITGSDGVRGGLSELNNTNSEAMTLPLGSLDPIKSENASAQGHSSLSSVSGLPISNANYDIDIHENENSNENPRMDGIAIGQGNITIASTTTSEIRAQDLDESKRSALIAAKLAEDSLSKKIEQTKKELLSSNNQNNNNKIRTNDNISATDKYEGVGDQIDQQTIAQKSKLLEPSASRDSSSQTRHAAEQKEEREEEEQITVTETTKTTSLENQIDLNEQNIEAPHSGEAEEINSDKVRRDTNSGPAGKDSGNPKTSIEELILSKSSENLREQATKTLRKQSEQQQKDREIIAQQQNYDAKREMQLAKEGVEMVEDKQLVQGLITEANDALKNAKDLTENAKVAKETLDTAVENAKNAKQKNEGRVDINFVQEYLENLSNEARETNHKAESAWQKYNELRRQVNDAVEKFNSKYDK